MEQHTLVVRRSCQARKQPQREIPPRFHSTFALYVVKDDPRSVKEAIESTKGKLWKSSIKEEMETLKKNTWDLVALSNGKKPIGSKRVFKK